MNVYLRGMKRLIFLVMITALFACTDNSTEYPKATSALTAGREFIDAFLKGNSEKARAYMVDDEENRAILERLHRQLKNRSEEDQQGYKESSIIIEPGGIETITENEVIIQYKSSYDRTPRKVKVVKKDGSWLVDLKYTLNPNL